MTAEDAAWCTFLEAIAETARPLSHLLGAQASVTPRRVAALAAARQQLGDIIKRLVVE